MHSSRMRTAHSSGRPGGCLIQALPWEQTPRDQAPPSGSIDPRDQEPPGSRPRDQAPPREQND